MLKLKQIIDRILFYLFYKSQYKRKFKSYGDNVRWGRDGAFLMIPKDIRISCPEIISIGSNVKVDEGVFLQCYKNGNGIEIGNGVRINYNTHIQAYSKITIEDKVLIAPFSLIHSGKHGNVGEAPIMDQEYEESGDIIIHSGSWLGHGSKVLGGSVISRNTTVAAGCIVNKKFTKESITLVGVPAREL